jgi:hypothetical protein
LKELMEKLRPPRTFVLCHLCVIPTGVSGAEAPGLPFPLLATTLPAARRERSSRRHSCRRTRDLTIIPMCGIRSGLLSMSLSTCG